ncbi:MAG: SDR family NAD(P)-dependent oxidoreductase [Candidatus Bathyarchaeia archaeon]
MGILKLKGKKVIVTGGGSGIGEAIAVHFAKEGAKVMVVGRTLEKLRRTLEKIREEGGSAICMVCDVSRKKDVDTMVSGALQKLGQVDILVNNAGIAPVTPFLSITEEEWDEVIDINLKGCFLCSQAVAKLMIERNKGGNIINISSISGFNPVSRTSVYSVSKAGVITLTRVMAMELAPYKIRVNAVAPGTIDTPIIKDIDDKKIVGLIPWGRLGLPSDIAKVALFLASDDSEFITGSTIIVDGGQIAGRQLPIHSKA